MTSLILYRKERDHISFSADVTVLQNQQLLPRSCYYLLYYSYPLTFTAEPVKVRILGMDAKWYLHLLY